MQLNNKLVLLSRKTTVYKVVKKHAIFHLLTGAWRLSESALTVIYLSQYMKIISRVFLLV